MKKMLRAGTSLAIPVLFLFAGCQDHRLDDMRTFKVIVENVSTLGLIPTMRANGTVPLSPGVFATYSTGDPVFMLDKPADLGTERIAEDGFTDEKVSILNTTPGIKSSGVFSSPGGPDDGPAIFAGESATFMITARPGDKLQIETMFVQSNDWFIGFKNGGLPLFTGTSPVGGDVSAQLEIYDAGTEGDTAPGTGPNQKPAQGPMATNVGPPDAVTVIKVAKDRHTMFKIPATNSVIRVTLIPL